MTDEDRRLLGLRDVWRQLQIVLGILEGLGHEHGAGQVVDPIDRARLGVYRLGIESVARGVDRSAPRRSSLQARTRQLLEAARPADREMLDRVARAGTLRPGVGGGRTSARWLAKMALRAEAKDAGSTEEPVILSEYPFFPGVDSADPRPTREPPRNLPRGLAPPGKDEKTREEPHERPKARLKSRPPYLS